MSLGGLSIRAIAPGGMAAVMLMAFGATSAWAEASTHCVKATKTATKPKHYTGGYTDKNCTAPSGTHQGKYEYIRASLLSEPEQEELRALLKYVKVVPSGVASKPTVRVSGANMQIVNGEGKTKSANGEGNLVIGYDENKEGRAQTGSHDLVLGEEQSFTSFGGIIAGRVNTLSGEFASVTGGQVNVASGTASSVTGGELNKASGTASSVSGGAVNKATELGDSVSGGEQNTASSLDSSVSGGRQNTASSGISSVSGGINNKATGNFASVSGGEANSAEGYSAWVGGGEKNTAGFKFSSIFGSKELKTKAEYEAIP